MEDEGCCCVGTCGECDGVGVVTCGARDGVGVGVGVGVGAVN